VSAVRDGDSHVVLIFPHRYSTFGESSDNFTIDSHRPSTLFAYEDVPAISGVISRPHSNFIDDIETRHSKIVGRDRGAYVADKVEIFVALTVDFVAEGDVLVDV
jgi:hypothetical protein